MSMLAGMMGESAAGSAAGSTAGSAADSAATEGAASSLGSAATAAASSPSAWSTLGSTLGQFGKDYAAGQANPYNTEGLGMNAKTFGQASAIGDQGEDAGGNALQSYLKKKQEAERMARGY